jgi:hypothetical protein
LGVLEATTLPGGQTLNYLSYGSGHLHQINCNGQVITDIERDALHRETARSQDPYLHTQRQNAAASEHARACASRLPFPQFSSASPDLPLSTPTLPVSYRSTPVFVIAHITLRNKFSVSI